MDTCNILDTSDMLDTSDILDTTQAISLALVVSLLRSFWHFLTTIAALLLKERKR